MVSKLDSYKCLYEEQHKLEWDLRQKDDEVCELQKGKLKTSLCAVYLLKGRVRCFSQWNIIITPNDSSAKKMSLVDGISANFP